MTNNPIQWALFLLTMICVIAVIASTLKEGFKQIKSRKDDRKEK